MQNMNMLPRVFSFSAKGGCIFGNHPLLSSQWLATLPTQLITQGLSSNPVDNTLANPTVKTFMEQQFYTAADLRHLLAKVRGSPVPRSTLKYWRNRLGIIPDENNLYFKSDLDILTALIRWLARAGTIPQFIKEIEKHNATRFN
jgi:hypothetical protein